MILQTGQYFTNNAHFMYNYLSDFPEILTASCLYCQYLTLVQISSQYHFPILRYRNLGPDRAKRAIWGRSVKYTHVAGGKNSMPQNY